MRSLTYVIMITPVFMTNTLLCLVNNTTRCSSTNQIFLHVFIYIKKPIVQVAILGWRSRISFKKSTHILLMCVSCVRICFDNRSNRVCIHCNLYELINNGNKKRWLNYRIGNLICLSDALTHWLKHETKVRAVCFLCEINR